ncbi:hypothetical protein D1BOALGB6SA_5404, partial [Olavius sp. associated proteobacterium Delta 1]
MVDKIKVNMTFNFSQDVIFTNAQLQIKCGVKKFVLNFWLAT